MVADTPNRRWYRLTPDRFIIGLLVAEYVLWQSDGLKYPAWHKGYAVLACVAVVGAGMLALLAWFVDAVISGRKVQFSLASLLLLVVFVALACSWLSVEASSSRRHIAALSMVSRSHGGVAYRWNSLDASGNRQEMNGWQWFDANGDAVANTYLPGPAWLRKLLGADFFSEFVGFRLPHATDSDLDRIGGLTELQFLDVSGSQITDAGMKNVAHLTELGALNLANTRVTAKGLEQIRTLPKLKMLVLPEAVKATKSDMEQLKEAFPNCDLF